ncbi:MAG: DMT family transporter [Myxococcales bacterium]|nr:MAG: DMT family transporter [Myxococcales bacterium]
MHRPSGRAGLGFALAMVTVVMWGVLPIGLKVALSGMDALTLTWYRFVAAATLLGAVLRLRGSLPRLDLLGRDGWRLLIIATLGLAANYALYVFGLDGTNAGTAQVVIQIAPVLLAVGSIWVFKEGIGRTQWLGLTVMVAGLVVFSRDQIVHMLEGLDTYYVGLACIVGAAVSWALYGLAQKQLLRSLPSASVMLCIYIGSAVLYAPFAEPAVIFRMSGAQLGALVFCIANMLVAYGTFAEALAHWDASRISAVLALVPLVTLAVVGAAATAMPTLVAPEPITVIGVGGACMVVSGSLLMALGRRTR